MKLRNATMTLMTLATAPFAAAATAAGSHAGGHGHDDAAIGQPGLAAKVTRTIQVGSTSRAPKPRPRPGTMATRTSIDVVGGRLFRCAEPLLRRQRSAPIYQPSP